MRALPALAPTPLTRQTQPGQPCAADDRDDVGLVAEAAEAALLNAHEAERPRLPECSPHGRFAHACERRDGADGEAALPALHYFDRHDSQGGLLTEREVR